MQHRQKKRLGDAKLHLDHNMGSGLATDLKHRGTNKRNRKWQQILGFTIEELKTHLERKFTDGMSWDNYGKWHVDHIIPKSRFNYTSTEDPDFKRAWALKNLQPMWAHDNFVKHNRLAKPLQPCLCGV